MSDIQRVVPPTDDELEEQWSRSSDEPELRDVEAFKPEDDDWRVVVAVAEFVREEPLESELIEGVESAIRSVSGVTNVWHEDREQWVVEGSPSGEQLVTAVADFLDHFAERAREVF